MVVETDVVVQELEDEAVEVVVSDDTTEADTAVSSVDSPREAAKVVCTGVWRRERTGGVIAEAG
jgi:hypothetical protein